MRDFQCYEAEKPFLGGSALVSHDELFFYKQKRV